MKKVLLSFLMLLAAFCVRAEVIPVTRAKAVAERFLKQADPSRLPQLQLLFEGPKMTKAGPTEPEYFIFTDARGGFVIAAGDDTVPAILGYSTTSSFRTDGMPENLRGWLDMWARIVNDKRLSGAAPYQQSAPTADGGGTKTIETALWDQSDPFNRYCVQMGDKRAVTGCTATATAIVMRYHQWPAAGTGKLASYTVADEDTGKSYTVEAIELGRPYAWDKMPLKKYDGTWSDEEKDEVAYLIRDIGVMLKSEYSPSGTGAYVEDVGPGLVQYMGYDTGYSVDVKSLYDNVDAWVARLKENIDQVGPIVYGAYTADEKPAGHAFVIDGYDENNMLRINWGWSGSGNGFFPVPSFNEYTEGHQALLGMKKYAGGTAPDDLRVYNIGLSTTATSFVTGTPFTMNCKSVGNYSAAAFSGDIAFALFDRNDIRKELISDVMTIEMDPGYGYSLSDVPCVINTEINPGDYVRVVYRTSATQDWIPVRYDHESKVVGRLAVGDTVFLDDIVALKYDSTTGILIVTFSDTASCELRRNGSAVTTGVTAGENGVTIDANQLSKASYTLHLQRGKQQKDITLKFGLK